MKKESWEICVLVKEIINTKGNIHEINQNKLLKTIENKLWGKLRNPQKIKCNY